MLLIRRCCVHHAQTVALWRESSAGNTSRLARRAPGFALLACPPAYISAPLVLVPPTAFKINDKMPVKLSPQLEAAYQNDRQMKDNGFAVMAKRSYDREVKECIQWINGLSAVSHQRLLPAARGYHLFRQGETPPDNTNMDHDFDTDFTLFPRDDTPDDDMMFLPGLQTNMTSQPDYSAQHTSRRSR